MNINANYLNNQFFKILNLNHMTLHLRSLFVIILFALGGSLYAQIGIGTQTPNDNAALEITSPDKGLLIPRIDLGSSATTFLNGTGANENGMFVYHTGTGLDGEGLYVWQYNSGTSSGTWLKFAVGDIGEVSEGSTTNATLRWGGSEWIENTSFTSDGSGNTSIAGTLDVTGATTFTGAVTASDALTINGLLTASNGFTVSGGAVDLGSSAVDLGTGTVTADGAITANGGVTSTGNISITNDGAGTSGNLSVEGTSTLTGDVTASGALNVTGDTKLSGKLTASDGTAGTDGQILTANSDGTIQWASPEAAPTVSTVDATGSLAATVGVLIINENATPADITMTLPTDASDGHTLRIRRNFTYTGTDDSVVIEAGASQTINGQSAKNLNVGFQSVTLVYVGNNSWVSID
jgi:hypothetical protein